MCDKDNCLSNANTASVWSASQMRRCIDVVTAGCALIILSPVLLLIALAIVATSGRPILFIQRRAGRNGVEFPLLKFRTMKVSVRRGSGLTQEGDARITAIGKILRKSKLDELPQLVNVLKGEMSLVGPRPDLSEFWNQASPEDRAVLRLTPGITGAASLAFSQEEKLLAQVSAQELTRFYLEQLLPAKARLDTEYAAQATFLSDCGILLRTASMPLVRWWQTAEKGNEIKTDEQISR